MVVQELKRLIQLLIFSSFKVTNQIPGCKYNSLLLKNRSNHLPRFQIVFFLMFTFSILYLSYLHSRTWLLKISKSLIYYNFVFGVFRAVTITLVCVPLKTQFYLFFSINKRKRIRNKAQDMRFERIALVECIDYILLYFNLFFWLIEKIVCCLEFK